MELRLLALYPEQMNIYADRGNILFLRRRCEWRGIGFELRVRRARRGLRPRGPRPDLHRRRPGPRPAPGRRGHARDQARRARGGGRRRRRGARRLRRLPAARPQLRARRASGSRGSGSPTSRPCASPGPRLIGNVAIEAELGERGTQVIAGFENHGGRTRLGAGRRRRSGRVTQRPRQQRRRRARGRPAPQPDRHLPPRPAAAQERLARRPPDRARARPAHRLASGAGAARRRARARRPRERSGRRARASLSGARLRLSANPLVSAPSCR